MEYLLIFLLFISFISNIQTQTFTEESPYLIVRLMDLKQIQWKPYMLNKLEKVLDSELKYKDEKQGIACKSIYFEQEPGYPKQDGRFLDISFQGICIDENDKRHTIPKDLITKAIIRRQKDVNTATTAITFRIGNVQIFERNRNKLNLIIIPISISFVTFLFVLTYFLRKMRIKQKHEHIITELQRKKQAIVKNPQISANIDPFANDKQRLLQLDPTVVGNISDTMGSPKEFTNEQYSNSSRNNITNVIDHRVFNREYQGTLQSLPLKENRALYNNREDDTILPTKRSLKSSRERIHIPHENESNFSPTHIQYHSKSQYPEMVSMHEQNPRVVVRSIRDDNSYPSYHQQPYEESPATFVSIPVQIEHSSSHQRFVSPPYHSDPYYPHANS